MTIISLFFHLMSMQYLIMAKEMYQNFQLRQELIIKSIMHLGPISHYTIIYRCQHLIWPLNQTMILLVATNMIRNPASFMWRIIISHRVKNNGPGAMAISDIPGIETLLRNS